MFTPTQDQLQSMRAAYHRILDGGEDGFAEVWLVWAQTVMATVNEKNATVPVIEKAMPMVMYFRRHTKPNCDEVGVLKAINSTALPALFGAKLDDRDDLNLDDARTAVAGLKTILGLTPKGEN